MDNGGKKVFHPKYELTEANDPLLREELEIFPFVNSPTDPIEFAYELVEHMLYYGGMGLAANQLGLPYRVFAIAAQPALVCYNPFIIDTSSEEIDLDEGCLTFPNVFFKVRRPKSIRIRYQRPNGEIVTETYVGMTARIMQHELDHLNGVLFIDHISKLKLDIALKKSAKYEQGYNKNPTLDFDTWMELNENGEKNA